MACIDVIKTLRTPKAASNGLSGSATPVIVQLGLATMRPGQPRPAHCASISATWSALTSGMSSGTSSTARYGEAFVQTAYPACANCGSISRATSAGSAEKTSFAGNDGSNGCTTISPTTEGGSPGITHLQTSA